MASARVKEWISRYLPAEILSAVVTIVAALVTYTHTNNRVATALVATWAGNISYFGYIIVRDVLTARIALKMTGKPITAATFARIIRALAVEFGLAEVLDSFFIRPALMYYLPIITGALWRGILLAKIIADITFYLPAIIGYEYAKKRFRNF